MSDYDDLVKFVSDQGISEQESQHAINHCLATMAASGIVTYGSAGVIAAFMNVTPASAIGFALTSFGAGAVTALVKAPQCTEVRQAVKYWNAAPF